MNALQLMSTPVKQSAKTWHHCMSILIRIRKTKKAKYTYEFHCVKMDGLKHFRKVLKSVAKSFDVRFKTKRLKTTIGKDGEGIKIVDQLIIKKFKTKNR